MKKKPRDKDLEEFLNQWLEQPTKARKPAAEIMGSGTGPRSCAPRMETRPGGAKRWVVKLNSRPNVKHVQRGYPAV